MEYFKQFVSNTMGAGGNQHHFAPEAGQVITGRAYYRITCGGTYDYSLLFSNIIDSTYADGSQSHCNFVPDSWKLHQVRLGICPGEVFGTTFKTPEMISTISASTKQFQTLTFRGETEKEVAPGEFFTSDPVSMTLRQDDYLCVEITCSGEDLPYHDESMLPIFRKEENGWEYNVRLPLTGMIGIRRNATRIGYLGDSITQGLGTTYNAYCYWNAILSKQLDRERYAFWNLGLGYSRAQDGAADGAWMYKARHNDIVFVCYGVNDLFRGRTEQQICQDLQTIAARLKAAGCKVIVQTVPPFNYPEDLRGPWLRINAFIRNQLSQEVDFVFDNGPILSLSEEAPYLSKHGEHPDDTGCLLWGNALYAALTEQKVLDI